MKLGSSRGLMIVDENKFSFMVKYESWNWKTKQYETMVYSRTNSKATAEKKLKKLMERIEGPIPEGYFKYDPEADQHRSKNARIEG